MRGLPGACSTPAGARARLTWPRTGGASVMRSSPTGRRHWPAVDGPRLLLPRKIGGPDCRAGGGRAPALPARAAARRILAQFGSNARSSCYKLEELRSDRNGVSELPAVTNCSRGFQRVFGPKNRSGRCVPSLRCGLRGRDEVPAAILQRNQAAPSQSRRKTSARKTRPAAGLRARPRRGRGLGAPHGRARHAKSIGAKGARTRGAPDRATLPRRTPRETAGCSATTPSAPC